MDSWNSPDIRAWDSITEGHGSRVLSMSIMVIAQAGRLLHNLHKDANIPGQAKVHDHGNNPKTNLNITPGKNKIKNLVN